MVGYSHKQLTGQSRERITHPDDVAADEDARSLLLAGDVTSDQREKRYVHASGQVIWAAVSVTLIRDADGLPVYFISQVQDVTERRSYEHQLRICRRSRPAHGPAEPPQPRTRTPPATRRASDAMEPPVPC